MKYYNKVFDIFFYEGVYIFLFSWLLLLLDDIYTEIFFKVSISSILIAGILAIIGRLFNLFVIEDNFEESWSNWLAGQGQFSFKINFQYFLKIRNTCFSFGSWNFLKQDNNSSAVGALLVRIGGSIGRWLRFMLFYW